jgi:DNA-binding NtrC family response regulator
MAQYWISEARPAVARILLAESDRAIREFIAGILTECGHDVQACENGIEASVWLASSSVDVLVTDMVLHSVQGVKLSRHCADLGIPTITLTGREFRANETPGDFPTLVEKPFRFADLQRVLNAVKTIPSTVAFPPQTAVRAEPEAVLRGRRVGWHR